MPGKKEHTETDANSSPTAGKMSGQKTAGVGKDSKPQTLHRPDKSGTGLLQAGPASERMTVPQGGIRVRMYRPGLGDCFLLAFPGADDEPFYMMIDCGVIGGTRDPGPIMENLVNDVAAATGGRVHVIVATHEHWDHVSGFAQAKSLFEQKLTVDNIWLAWTEDPANHLAAQLRRERGHQVQALRAVVRRMHAAGLASAGGIEEILTFFGEGFAAASGQSTSGALDNLKGFSKTPPRFCRPTDPPLELKHVPGVRFYVLAPPENLKLLGMSDPTKTGKETYEAKGMALNSSTAFFAAAAATSGDSPYQDPELQQLSLPFDKVHQIPVDEAGKQPFFREHYYAKGEDWRHIDNDWLESAGQLALQLDSDTNNTSLVLAIEMLPAGKVLLFAADAQVGNWLSWDSQAWSVLDAHGNRQQVTASDLLKRTVLYKVGHHGSHNATLREKGLERMLSPDLVAMIPVDHDMALKKKWNMPFPPLLDRLKQKTSSRVIRIDDATPPRGQLVPAGVPRGLWSAFQASVTRTELYLDFTVAG